jgi:hypothetical protein
VRTMSASLQGAERQSLIDMNNDELAAFRSAFDENKVKLKSAELRGRFVRGGIAGTGVFVVVGAMYAVCDAAKKAVLSDDLKD